MAEEIGHVIPYDVEDIDEAVRFAREHDTTPISGSQKPITSGAVAAVFNEANTKAANVVLIQQSQPASEENKIWIPGETADEYTIPTYDEFEDVKSALDVVVTQQPGVNLFDGSFPQSGYLNPGEQPSSNFKRTDYVPIYGQNNGYVYIYLSETVDTFILLAYDENKTYISGSTVQANNVTTKTGVLPSNAAYFRCYTRTSFSGNATISLSYVSSYVPYALVPTLKNSTIDFQQLNSDVQEKIGYYEVPTFVNGINKNVLVGCYLLDNTYKPYGIAATSGQYRLKMKNSGGTVLVNGEDVGPEYYSDKIQRFVDYNTRKVVAYYILHYTGTNYSSDSDSYTWTSNASDLSASPVIQEYLSRKENLVLIGDSIFGNNGKNVLEACLATISDKQVFNCGFGGCQMAWRSADGSNNYDKLSFVDVADAIAADDYSAQSGVAGLNNAYPYRVASLDSVDFTKPTTIFVNYVNNDITNNAPIGDAWNYTDALTDFNKQSVLGAFNYGVSKILTAYPHVRIVEFTSAWRKLGSPAVPPYAYTNTLGKSPTDYDTAIKDNAQRQGIAVYDFFKDGGRNYYNTSYYQADNSHYNEKGFALFAKILDALSRSFID